MHARLLVILLNPSEKLMGFYPDGFFHTKESCVKAIATVDPAYKDYLFCMEVIMHEEKPTPKIPNLKPSNDIRKQM